MKKKKPGLPPAKQKSVRFTLPEDEVQILVEARAMATVTILRDFLAGMVKRDREAVEDACRESLVLWQANSQYTVPLTNDFSSLCAVYLPAYTQTYLECCQIYDMQPEKLERDKRLAADISWIDGLRVMHAHYRSELGEQKS